MCKGTRGGPCPRPSGMDRSPKSAREIMSRIRWAERLCYHFIMALKRRRGGGRPGGWRWAVRRAGRSASGKGLRAKGESGEKLRAVGISLSRSERWEGAWWTRVGDYVELEGRAPRGEACQIYLITSLSLRRRPAPSLPLPPSRRRVSRSPTSPPEPRSPSSVCPTNSNPCPNHTSSYLACPTTQLDNSSVPLTHQAHKRRDRPRPTTPGSNCASDRPCLPPCPCDPHSSARIIVFQPHPWVLAPALSACPAEVRVTLAAPS